jgi:hypothetical protein
MLPSFIFPETTVEAKGNSEPLDLGESAGSVLLLTLGILEVVEQESLDIAIWGSADGEDWGEEPLRAFPQKFYDGTSQILMDLGPTPDVKFLRADWKVHRWGVGSTTPMFRFYVFAEPFSGELSQRKSA